MRWLMGLLAVALPALVLTLAVSALTRREPPELSAPAALVEAQLSQADPQVLLVGNSLLGRGVDGEALGQALGARALVLWEPATRPANWYAVLKNRVYENGHAPHLVVLVTTPNMLLQTALTSDRARKSLSDHVSDYEPVINAKVYGVQSEDSVFMHRLQEGRGAFQSWSQAAVRDASAGLFFGEGEGTLVERGAPVAAGAMEAVFGGEDSVDMSLHHRVIPVLQATDDPSKSVEETAEVEQSFVPELIDEIEGGGGRLVIAWIPLSARENPGAAVDPVAEAALIDLLNARGVGWIDLHDMAMPEDRFVDPKHLNSKGAAEFTAALAQALVAMDAMGEGPLPRAGLPLVLEPVVTRTGQPTPPPALDPDALKRAEGCGWEITLPELKTISNFHLKNSRLGATSPLLVFEDGQPLERAVGKKGLQGPCAGAFTHFSHKLLLSPGGDDPDAALSRRYTLGLSPEIPLRDGRWETWWIYPGTTLRFELPGWPGEEASLTVQAWLEPRGEGPLQVRIGGKPATLEPRGRWSVATAALPRRAGPWSVEIESPGGGPFAALRWLTVRGEDPGRAVDSAGGAAMVEPATLLLKHPGKGAIADQERAPVIPLKVARDKRGVSAAPVGAMDALAHRAVGARIPCHWCGPLTVTEDGAPLAVPKRDCKAIKADRAGRYCVADGEARFVASDGSDASANGRAYALTLNPDRRVREGWWIYPGDTYRFDADPRATRTMEDGGRTLTLQGLAFLGVPDAAVTVRITADDRPLLERATTGAELEAGLEVPLEIPLSADARQVTLTIEAGEDAPYVLLTDAHIRE